MRVPRAGPGAGDSSPHPPTMRRPLITRLLPLSTARRLCTTAILQCVRLSFGSSDVAARGVFKCYRKLCSMNTMAALSLRLRWSGPAQAESVRVWETKTPSKTKQCDASMRSAPTVTMALSNGIVLRRAIVATSVAALTIVSLHGADSSKPSASISVPTTSAVKPPGPRPSGNGMDTWRRVCNGQRRDMQRQVFVLTSEPHRCTADPLCEGERILDG